MPDPKRPAAPAGPGKPEEAYVEDASWGVLTAPFNDGDRLLAFRCRAVVGSGLSVGLAALSELGLSELDLYEGNSKLFRETAQRCVEQVPGAEIPFARCLFLLKRAADIGQEHGRSPPRGYRDLQHLLGPAWSGDPEHPARAIRAGPLPSPAEQAALWDLPELKHWVPPRALWPEIERRFQEVGQSRLVLDAGQRQEQISRVIRWAAAECFDPPRRPFWAERLTDAAWVATARRYHREAAQLLALAEQILKNDFEPAELDFCRYLVIRPGQEPFRPSEETAPSEEEPETPPLLWTPGQPLPGPDGQGEPGGGGLIVPGR